MATFHLWPGVVEILIKAGFDYLIVDLEHTHHDMESVVQTCTMGRLAGLPILIRPTSTDVTLMRIAMDAGAVGMLLPYVESLEDLKKVQDAVCVPPNGRRRPGGAGVFWVSGYNHEHWKTEVEDHLIILPQIESRKGLQNVEAIAAHPLTTAMAVGPFDLSADLGVLWQPENPKLLAAIDTVRAAGKKAGKNMWMIGPAQDLKARGFTFICATETSICLQSALSEIRQQFKGSGETREQPLP